MREASQGHQGPVLVGQSGTAQGSRWALTEAETVIGRDAECQVVIPDRQVSRRHARIRRQADGYWIEDLGSKNGTHVNGVAVKGSAQLQDGDLIQIALAAKLVFIGLDATVPLGEGEAAEHDLGLLRLDRGAHRAWVGASELDPPLSPQQFRLLELLYLNPTRIVTREEVVEHVWQESLGSGVSEQAIDALVRRLRERLSEHEPGVTFIETVRGLGFRLKVIS
jgi:pSer/pThr/pTyr-binding forkhead associated (FHA) protein